MTEAGRSWLTMSVQVGFVSGTLLSAFFNISDIFNTRTVFSVSALMCALCNGAIGLFASSVEPALALRFFTGVFLAGVYPTGMKIMAAWFTKGRGMAIGVLVGALIVGSASPHLLKLFGDLHWRGLIVCRFRFRIGGSAHLFVLCEGRALFKQKRTVRLAVFRQNIRRPGHETGKFRLSRPYVGIIRRLDMDSRISVGKFYDDRYGKRPRMVGVHVVFGYGDWGNRVYRCRDLCRQIRPYDGHYHLDGRERSVLYHCRTVLRRVAVPGIGYLSCLGSGGCGGFRPVFCEYYRACRSPPTWAPL